MQTSILTLMLALGVPGANSCNAQQQGLPRVGAPPPPAVSETVQAKPAPAPELAEAEEVEVGDMDVDDAPEADEMEFEESELAAPPCEVPTPLPGAQAGTFVYTLRGEAQGGGQSLTLTPGSALILDGAGGNHVKVYAHGGGHAGSPFMAQSAPQNQDERVRELEARVRELEAQLRARDDQRVQRYSGLGYVGSDNAVRSRALAEEQRARARALGDLNRKQARDYAEQARKQAAEMRQQAEVLRKQLLDESGRWRIAEIPEHAIALPPVPCPPTAPCAPNSACAPKPQCDPIAPCPQTEECPEVVEVPRVAIATTTPHVRVMRRGGSSGGGSGAAPAPQAAHAEEMRAMMDDMRKQMDEMRQQMQALREELQNAPKRELH